MARIAGGHQSAEDSGVADIHEGRATLRTSLKQSLVEPSRGDIANEELRARLNTIQYELDAVRQERELSELRHQQELRDVQSRAEIDSKRAETAENACAAAQDRANKLQRKQQDAEEQLQSDQGTLERKLRTLQDDNLALQEEVEELQAELSTKERQHQHASSELESKCRSLDSAATEIREDLMIKTAAAQTFQNRLAQKEQEIGELENEVLRLKAQTGDTETLDIIKKELSEQVNYIKRLESINREQSVELKQFRKTQKSVEIVEEEKRALEVRVRASDDLRKQLAESELQRRILEDEKLGWTSYLQETTSADNEVRYDTPEQLAKAFLQERLEKLSLVDKLGAVQPELAIREESVHRLEAEKAALQAEIEALRDASKSNQTLASTSDPSDRTRSRLERQKTLLAKENEYLRARMKTLEAEQEEFSPENIDQIRSDQSRELEGMVEQYRAELESLHADLIKLEQQLSHANQQRSGSMSPRKRARDDEHFVDERVGEFRRKTRALQEDLERLQTKNSMLEAELKANTKQLQTVKASSRTRVLELRTNPTAEAEAIKMSTLRTLREENAALLSQLEGRPNGKQTVPMSTLDNFRLQYDELKAQMAQTEKKTLRLKQIWGSKALEFREAVCSILGWKLDFMPNGRVKATSILYPSSINDGEEEENSIVFDGENGTMKVSGGPQSMFASEIKGLIEFWVEGRKEIPCFLAACTLEFYDRTTRAIRM